MLLLLHLHESMGERPTAERHRRMWLQDIMSKRKQNSEEEESSRAHRNIHALTLLSPVHSFFCTTTLTDTMVRERSLLVGEREDLEEPE